MKEDGKGKSHSAVDDIVSSQGHKIITKFCL